MARSLFRRHDRLGLRVFLASALGALLSVPLLPVPAEAALPTPAYISTSWYMRNVSGATHDNLGCRQANSANAQSTPPSYFVFLLYGDPRYEPSVNRYGATAYTGFASAFQVGEAVRSYVNGYFRCIKRGGGSYLRLVMGVTNRRGRDFNPVGYGHGQAWANEVRRLQNYVDAQGYSGGITVQAGNDLELEYNDYEHGSGWLDGVASVPPVKSYQFGSSSGCPRDNASEDCRVRAGYQDAPSDAVFTYSQEQIYQLNYGKSVAFSIPQTYNYGLATDQRYQNSRYRFIGYNGVLTQQQACAQTGGCANIDEGPASAYNRFATRLESNPATDTGLGHATDIKHCYATNGGPC